MVLAVVFFVLWQRASHREPVATATAPVPAAEATPEATPSPSPDNSAQLRQLTARLADETGARQRAEAEAAALRQQTPRPDTNAAIGRIQDNGKRAGAFLPSMGELGALTRRDATTLSADEKRRLLELQREQARLLGSLPEIVAYQDNPEEYGRFFSSMIQQAAGLSDAQTVEIENYMRARGLAMNQAGLNAALEPTDPKLEEEWEERRDAFNAQTAQGLKGILPPEAAQKAVIGPELLEFLEMDFDKITPPASQQATPEK